MLDELLAEIGRLDAAGPSARNDSGKRAVDLMAESLAIPGGIQAIVERFSPSENRATANGIAFVLGEAASSEATRTPETVNLIYAFLERTPGWARSRMVNNALGAIRDQVIYNIPWFPSETVPPVLHRFLLHCLTQEPDDENDNAATAVNILWNLQLWADDRGGLQALFNPGERQAFRDAFEEAGLEPGPILDALGKD